MIITDPLAALISYLKVDGTVSALVGTRVFGGELPRAEASSMPRAAVVLSYSGGLGVIGSGYQEYGDVRIDALCWGATPHQADEVRRRVHPALKQLQRVVVGDCLLHWCMTAGGPVPLRDPDTDWPYVFTSWQVLASEIPAA